MDNISDGFGENNALSIENSINQDENPHKNEEKNEEIDDGKVEGINSKQSEIVTNKNIF